MRHSGAPAAKKGSVASCWDGQTAVITGASSGIGRAIALQLAGCKVRLCLVGRNRARLAQTAGLCRKTTQSASTLTADLARPGAAARLGEQISNRFGSVDILVHAAGFLSLGPVGSAGLQDFQRQLSVSVLGPYLLTQKLLPCLERCQGQIVFINSTVVGFPRPETVQYAAAKHALKGMADGIRAEVNHRGIRVLSVFPGRTATPMQERLYLAEGKEYHPERLLQPGDVAAVVLNALSLPRSAEVTDVYLRPMMRG